MPLFKVEKNKAKKLDTIQRLEKELQKLVESNLEEILGIHFVYSEFPTSFGGRIDTLGLDKNGSPVIIEYKRTSNDNVINQALSYLKWILDHRAEFEKLVIFNPKLENIETDWTTPRVICIAESYNKFDLDTVDILPINIELIKYRLYDGFLTLDTENYQKVNIQTSGIFKKAGKLEKQPSLQKNYSVSDLFKANWKDTKSLFEKLREGILTFDKNITEKITKHYIAYKIENNFCEVIPQQKGMWVHIDMPLKKAKSNKLSLEDVSKVGHWATGQTKFYVNSEKDIEEALEIIKQSYHYSQ